MQKRKKIWFITAVSDWEYCIILEVSGLQAIVLKTVHDQIDCMIMKTKFCSLWMWDDPVVCPQCWGHVLGLNSFKGRSGIVFMVEGGFAVHDWVKVWSDIR